MAVKLEPAWEQIGRAKERIMENEYWEQPARWN